MLNPQDIERAVSKLPQILFTVTRPRDLGMNLSLILALYGATFMMMLKMMKGATPGQIVSYLVCQVTLNITREYHELHTWVEGMATTYTVASIKARLHEAV